MEVAVSSTINTVSGGVALLPYIPEFETQAGGSLLSWDYQSVRFAFGFVLPSTLYPIFFPTSRCRPIDGVGVHTFPISS